ncbi:MAG: lipopolysaccharide core heptose(I) kinase RfaP [Gammaproteobacteria bacterium]
MWTRQDVREVLGPDPVATAFALDGVAHRAVANRATLAVELGARPFFLKRHRGVGWREILKNLFSGRLPVVSAWNEFAACQVLADAGIPAPTAAAFGRQGLNPARCRSFVLCDALLGYTDLEQRTARWLAAPPSGRLRSRLVAALAEFARRFHDAGLVHRDFYLCHLLADDAAWAAGAVRLAVLDLHRALRFRVVPSRWRERDLAALLYSARALNPSRFELLRFVRVYSGVPLRTAFADPLWRRVWRRAARLERRVARRRPDERVHAQ